MFTKIIKIGNSKGVRLSKSALVLSGLEGDVEVVVKRGEIKLVPAKPSKMRNDLAAASEASFAKDWLRPEEEAAWATYQ